MIAAEETRAQTQAQTVAAAIRRLKRVTMVPEVTMRIVQITSSSDYQTSDLCRLVSTDPILCVRILRIVNSAFYGLAGEVRSLERAVVLLGADAIKNIALVASLGGLLQSSDGACDEHARLLWNHSLGVAVAARKLAETSDVANADEAFLGGLLHDIGFAIEMRYDAKRFDLCVRRMLAEKGAILEIERELFGATHVDFAVGLCEKWELPAVLRAIAASHHGGAAPAGRPAEEQQLCLLVRLADHLAARYGTAFYEGSHHAEDEMALARSLRLTRAQLETIGSSIPDLTDELRRALG